ncbi:MAG: CehA/McbA family metallohydrolase [Armatimonadota bacterium]|nr:CehA/McbA family metallohydrolase [Armatimonadota bacterium]
MRTVAASSPEPLIAGSLCTWHYEIALRGAPIEEGGCVKIAYDLRGESGYNAFPQAEQPAAENYATCTGPDGVELRLEGYRSQHASHGADTLEERIESESYFWRDLLGIYSSLNLHILRIEVLSGRLAAGDVLHVTLGDTSRGSPGMQVPGQAKPDWRHWVCVQRQADAPLELLGGDVLVVHPAEPERLHVVAPSIVTPDEEVGVAHVALDALGNPVRRVRVQFPAAAAEPEQFECPEGSHMLDRVRLDDDRVGLSGQSNPIEIVEEPQYRLFWGEIHGHTCLSDGGQRTPDQFYRWGRDTALLDFCAIADHDFGIALYDPQKHWQMMLDAARDFNESGRFVTIPGWEVSHAGLVEGRTYGHKNVYFLDDDPPFFSSSPYGKWRANMHYVHIEELVELLEDWGGEFMIADHTSHMMTDWDRFVPEHTRLAEVYSLFGGSEAIDTPFPVGRLVEERTSRAALDRGCMIGFTGGTDTHMGAPAAFRETTFGRGTLPGLTAVWATELSRHAIWDALYSRRTYATRAERILLHTAVNGEMMGGEVRLQASEEERRIGISVAGTGPIQRVDLIHNGATLRSWTGKGRWEMAIEFEHQEPMAELPRAPGLGYYYARVVQDNGGVAWSSPTWVRLPQ